MLDSVRDKCKLVLWTDVLTFHAQLSSNINKDAPHWFLCWVIKWLISGCYSSSVT